MEIWYINKYCLVLKGKKEQVIINPEDAEGLKSDGRVVLSTRDNWKIKRNENQVLIAGPGEYEVGGVEVLGVSAGEGASVYCVTVDGVTVGVLGQPVEDLSDKKIDRIESVDALLVPADSQYLPKLKTYLGWAKTWGVNYLIPVGYGSAEELAAFLEAMDQEGTETVNSLKVDRGELPEGMEVVVLKAHE